MGNSVNALFDRSLDTFAKIVPGLILLLALVGSLLPWDQAFDYVCKTPEGAWLPVVAVSWVLGFAVQSFGETFGLIRYYPCRIDADEGTIWMNLDKWYKIKLTFMAIADQEHKDQSGRLSLIKEACGNCYVALLIATLLLLTSKLHQYEWSIRALAHWACSNMLIPILDVAVIAFLCIMHCKHISRQYKYMSAVFKLKTGRRHPA